MRSYIDLTFEYDVIKDQKHYGVISDPTDMKIFWIMSVCLGLNSQLRTC